VKISANCLTVSMYLISIFLLYMISQKVVSPLKVSHYLVEDWIFGYKDGTGVIAHEGNSLKAHCKVSHDVHNLYGLATVATYSASIVNWATEDYF
jgi:hypothetical protein